MAIRFTTFKRHRHLRKPTTAWHPLFVGTVRVALPPDGYEILSEYQLNQQPLRIDVVVIRKRGGAPDDASSVLVQLTIHFGPYTLIEFKGPSDELSAADWLYLSAYATLFCALNSCLPPAQVHLMVVANRVTDSFRAEVQRYHGVFRELSPGVYEVTGLPFRLVCVETERCGGVLRVFSRQMRQDPQSVYHLLSESEKATFMEVYDELQRQQKDQKPWLRYQDYEEFRMSLQEIEERFLSHFPAERRLKGLPTEDLVKRLSAKDMIAGLADQNHLDSLSDEDLEQMEQLIARRKQSARK